MPVLGICAGMIMLSKTAQDKVVGKIDQPLLNILDIKLERNSFGRQRESFESDISLNSMVFLHSMEFSYVLHQFLMLVLV